MREAQTRETGGLPFRKTEAVDPRTGQQPTQPAHGNWQAPTAATLQDQQTQQFQNRQTAPQDFPAGRPQQPQQRPAAPPQQAQPGGGTRNLQQQQPQRPPQQPNQPAQTGQFRTPPPPMAPPTLSFSVPDQGGFLARLIDNFKNIGDAFRGGGKVAQAGAGDFQFLLPEESLVDRIMREISTAFRDFARDPKGFIVELARGEGSNRFRRNALLAGSEMALAGYATLYFISQIVSAVKKGNSPTINFYFIAFAAYLGICYLTRGFLLYKFINRVTGKLAVPKVALEFANWIPIIAVLFVLVFRPNYNFYCMLFPAKCTPPEEKVEEPLENIAMIANSEYKPELKKAAVEKKQIGGSKPKPQAASGGGGGGRQQPTPPSKGVPPQMALTPQIIPPNPEPPKIKNPTLVVASTIYGDPKAIPPMKGPIGDPTGVPAPPSSGPGTGAGIGRGAGTGVGGGQGGGLGPGQGGNVGGGNMGIGGGGSVEPMTASVRPKILYQEKAKYTEEARQNKVQGTVMLSVVFTADGQIQNIRVVRGLPDGLTEKAIEAAKRIRFQPAVKNGQAVSVRGTLEFSFNLY